MKLVREQFLEIEKRVGHSIREREKIAGGVSRFGFGIRNDESYEFLFEERYRSLTISSTTSEKCRAIISFARECIASS